MKLTIHYLIAASLLILGCGSVADDVPIAPVEAASPPASAALVRIPPGSASLDEISVATVETARIPRNLIVAPGKIELNPNRTSRVTTPLPGRVTGVRVRLGDAVARGQPLLRLDCPDAYAVQVNYRQAQASISESRAVLSKAQADAERQQSLYEHRATARKTVLAAKAELAQAKAQLEQALAAGDDARHRLTLLGLDPGAMDELVCVRAPVSGKVLEISVAPGEYRNDISASLMTIADLSSVWVTSNVPETEIRWVNLGERIEIRLAAYPGEVFHARVSRIADTLDPQTRTVRVWSELPNPHGRFRPEMFGEMRHSHGSETLPVAPATAVIRDGAGSSVFLERETGLFERVPVETGAPLNGHIPIRSGLKPGDRVVTRGAILLRGR